MNYFVNKRITILYRVFVIVFLFLGGHLAYIQAINGDQLGQQALSQQTQTVPLEIPARGEILDRQLKPLVGYLESFRIVVFPAAIQDREFAASLLSSLLHQDYDKVISYLEGQPKIIPYDLSQDEISVLRQKKIPGLIAAGVKIRQRRPDLAAHIIGYTAKDDKAGVWTGKTGIEFLFENFLKGRVPQSRVRLFLDGRGKYIPGLDYKIESGIIDAERKNVVLTIDREIQQIVERAVSNAGIRDGSVVVMDVDSGDVVAMASYPGYQLNQTVKSAVYETSFVNRAISQYQPGSVFKVVVAAAGIEEGVVSPETIFLCAGEKDPIVRCYERQGHGIINFEQAVAYSCNPTFARVGIKVGAAKLTSYARKFGLGETEIIGYKKIGSDQPLEKIARDFNLVNASIGQWPVESSVVQATAMINTIANNGVYVKPRLVKEIRDHRNRVVKTFAVDKGTRIISANTASVMQNMLGMVTKVGTGKNGWVPVWGSAGKTGSAQVAQEKTDAWFSGYAPLANPRYSITVMVNDGESGGKTAAPVFREIMQQILALSEK